MSFETIHPLFVHFPIALFSNGLFFDILEKLFSKEELEHAGFWTMLMGLISCLFTNITGIIAFLEEGAFSDLPQFRHSFLAWVATLLFLTLFWVRIQFKQDLRNSTLKRNIYFFLHVLAVGILFYGAHLGAGFAERY